MKPDFRAIALPLIKRGLRVVPVHPETKKVAIKNFQNFQIVAVSQLEEIAPKFPHHNVGVVGKRGIDRHFFLDDDTGVAERIEREIGKKMPLTYTVQSRPESDPLKKHFYFTHTPYSLKRFGLNSKNFNRRDTTKVIPSPSGGRMFQTQYDLKGIGGGAIVVGAGSIRKPDATGHCEVYTGNDADILAVPNYLVDWFIADKQAYRRELRRDKEKQFAKKMRAAKISPEERERLRAIGHPDGFDIFPEDRHPFLFTKSFKLAKEGIVGQANADALTYFAERHIEGGKAYVQSQHGKESIAGMAAYASKHWKDAKIVSFYKLKTGDLGDLVMEPPPVTRMDILRDIVQGFPDRLPSEDALAQLAEGMKLNGFDFDKRKDKDALYDLRRELGFEVSSASWWRIVQTPLTNGSPYYPFIYTGEATRHVASDLQVEGDNSVASDLKVEGDNLSNTVSDKGVRS